MLARFFDQGAGAVVVTFTVGGLSVINAIAGAYSDDLPIIVISGGPNSNDYGSNRVLHHTIGLPDFSQQLQCFKQVTCYQTVVRDATTAAEQIEAAIEAALTKRKPVYIEISCNMAAVKQPRFAHNLLYAVRPQHTETYSDPVSLEAAVTAAADFLNGSVKPVMVAGVKLRPAGAIDAFKKLADASDYCVAVMPNAKGFFPEDHPNFIGTYWGQVSSPYCCETVEAADAYVFAGALINDYTTTGYSLLIKKEKMVLVQENRVTVGDIGQARETSEPRERERR